MRNKLERFRDNELAKNFIQPGKGIFENIKGSWRKEFFGNNNPIILELGCGSGLYTASLASAFPQNNYIGVDIKGSRMWQGSQMGLENGLKNICFLRTKIEDLEKFFYRDEVSEIIITFADPQPKKRNAKRRLTSMRFLDIYSSILKEDGSIYLKTDNHPLYQYSLETITEYGGKIIEYTDDLYGSSIDTYHKIFQTTYEKKFIEEGLSIKYIKFECPKKSLETHLLG